MINKKMEIKDYKKIKVNYKNMPLTFENYSRILNEDPLFFFIFKIKKVENNLVCFYFTDEYSRKAHKRLFSEFRKEMSKQRISMNNSELGLNLIKGAVLN